MHPRSNATGQEHHAEMAPVVVLAGGGMLSHLPTPEGCLHNHVHGPLFQRRSLVRGWRIHGFLLSPVKKVETLWPLLVYCSQDAHTHEAGALSHLWIPGFRDDQELGPGIQLGQRTIHSRPRPSHSPNCTLKTEMTGSMEQHSLSYPMSLLPTQCPTI